MRAAGRLAARKSAATMALKTEAPSVRAARLRSILPGSARLGCTARPCTNAGSEPMAASKEWNSDHQLPICQRNPTQTTRNYLMAGSKLSLVLPPQRLWGISTPCRRSVPDWRPGETAVVSMNAPGSAAFPRPTSVTRISSKTVGGPSRNRTGVNGFAVRCVTTPPSGPDRVVRARHYQCLAACAIGIADRSHRRQAFGRQRRNAIAPPLPLAIRRTAIHARLGESPP